MVFNSKNVTGRVDRGSALISALIGLLLLIVGVVTFSKVVKVQSGVENILKSKRSVIDVESSIRAFMWRNLYRYSKEYSCNKNKWSPLFSDQTVGDWAFPTFLKESLPFTSAATPIYKGAATRCGSPLVPSAGSTSARFCLALDRVDKATPRFAFLSSAQPFLEAHVAFIDIRDKSPVSCQSLAQSDQSGVVVNYAIHWMKPIAGQETFSFYQGWFYASMW